MTCTKTRDGGCACSHAHCTLCGECLTCSPHPAHAKDDGFPGKFRGRGRR